MLDVEEGELIENISETELGEGSDVGANWGNQESNRRNSRQIKKKKNKRKRGGTGPNVTNINSLKFDLLLLLFFTALCWLIYNFFHTFLAYFLADSLSNVPLDPVYMEWSPLEAGFISSWINLHVAC